MIEKFYRRMIDGLPSAVIVADGNLKAVFANEKFRQLFPSAKRRGSLGSFFCCAEDTARCGSSGCSRDCTAREAFEDITSLEGDGFVDGVEVTEPPLTINVYTNLEDFPEITLRFGAHEATSYVLENGVQPPMLVSASSVDTLIRTWSYMP